MRQHTWGRGLGVIGLVLVGRGAAAQSESTPLEASAPYPTLENISLEWPISGDDNLNGQVTARFRESGGTFRDALPLFRVPAGSRAGHDWVSMHAGSLFGLRPSTTYEVELTLTDPDGGDDVTTLTVTTRSLPVDPLEPNVVEVTPTTLEGALAEAVPGDVLLLGPGDYDAFAVETSGTAEAPIVLRSEPKGAAIVTGEVTLSGTSFVHVDGLTIHGRIRMNDVESMAVLNCTIDTDEHGIVAWAEGSTSSVIAYNTITGPTAWAPTSLGVDGDNLGEGVDITGPGNVVAFNRVSGFRDCLSLLESDEAIDQTSVDFYGNDLFVCADDAIEADYARANVRVYENRIRESFMGISSQPGLGGPVYFVRNVMHNVIYEAFKLHNESVGNVLLHNTVVKSGDAFAVYTDDAISNAWSRNNVFFGGPGGTYGGYDSGSGRIMELRSSDATCSYDYDAFGTTGSEGFFGYLGDVNFQSLEELQAQTTEEHAIELELSDFVRDVSVPADPFDPPELPDLAPGMGSLLVDSGVVLANVNGDYDGEGPDRGAYEVGQLPPVYGPEGNLDPGAAPGLGGSSSGSGGEAGANAVGGGPSGDGGTTGSGASGVGGTGTDGGSEPGAMGGCGCHVAGGEGSQRWWLPLALLALVALRGLSRTRRGVR